MVAAGSSRYRVMTKREDLLFLEDVAAITRVSIETVRFWIKRGRLASIRPGRRRMVRREDLETFLARSVRP